MSKPDKNPLTFLDAETTGLDAEDLAEPFELAWVYWDEATQSWKERVIWLPVDLNTASEDALSKNRYYERVDECTKLYGVSAEEGSKIVSRELTSKQIAGANPAFDMRIIRRFLRKNSKKAAWFYRPLDVTDYAAGFVGLERPWNLDTAAKALGIPELPNGERHTALGDARLARDVYLKTNELKNRIEFFRAVLRGVKPSMCSNGNGHMTETSLDGLAESIAKAQVELVESRGKKERQQKSESLDPSKSVKEIA